MSPAEAPQIVSDWVTVMKVGGPYLIILVETAVIGWMAKYITTLHKRIEWLAAHKERRIRKR